MPRRKLPGRRDGGRRPMRNCSTEREYPVNTTHGCTAEQGGIGGRRPERRYQSEKRAGEQASLDYRGWNPGQGARSTVARRLRWMWDAHWIGGKARLCSL
ncbi:MAG: hypothetical protein JAY66_28200 [Candidatus Thiodiazotropha taylori]|nr:hypothetical protein [Candidatus Thiodiazotropha taylori]